MCDIGSQRQEDLSALLMVTGYIAKKTMLRMTCEACKQKFGNRELQQLNFEIDSDLLRYFESINRGGFTYPSNFLCNVIQCAYNVFKVCISKCEKEFLEVVNQKQTLMGLFEKHISSIDYFSDHLLVCDVCKVELITNVMQSLSCFANIILKKYSISKSESISAVKIARKVSKFELP